MSALLHLMIFTAGFIAGFFIVCILIPTFGTMYIAHMEDKDRYRLEITYPMEKLPKHKYIMVAISQEKQSLK